MYLYRYSYNGYQTKLFLEDSMLKFMSKNWYLTTNIVCSKTEIIFNRSSLIYTMLYYNPIKNTKTCFTQNKYSVILILCTNVMSNVYN